MHKRLIDANALMQRLVRKKCEPAKVRYTDGFNDALMRFRSMLHDAPTVDAVPVVRCKDCKNYDNSRTFDDDDVCKILYYCDGSHRTVCEMDFCSYGIHKDKKCLTGEDNGNAAQNAIMPCC